MSSFRWKRPVRLLVACSAVALLAATLVVGVARTGGVAAQEATPAAGSAKPRTVSVTGHGSVTVVPDTATITIGVDITQPTLDAAQTQATQQMTAIINTVKGAGVAAKDIQTSNYNVNVIRQQDQNGNTGKVTGFEVTNTVNVTLRDLSKLGTLLDAVVAQGANNIYGISFSVGNPTAAASQARKLAVQDARAKADELAAATGTTIGPVLTITETSSTPPPPSAMASAAVGREAAAPVPIEAGSTEVDVDVQITYELE